MFCRVLCVCGILYLHFAARAAADHGRADPTPKPSAATKTHYDVLELPRDCSVTQIKKAYRQLALALHPDKVRMSVRYADLDLEMAKAMFLDVQTAYSVLAAPGKRRPTLRMCTSMFSSCTQPARAN